MRDWKPYKTKRHAYGRALAENWYQPDRALAALVKIDGGWAVKKVIPWAAVASIPMPVRRPDTILLVGAYGSEKEAE